MLAADLDFIRKHIGWIVGGLGCLILGFMLHHSQGQTRAANDRSAAWEKLFHAEQSAFRETVANVRARTAQAKAADAAHALKVERDQSHATQEVSSALQAQLADARRRYADALRVRARAAQVGLSNPGGGGAAPVSSPAGPASGIAGQADEGGLPPEDALTCTENSLRLQGWQDWWARESAVPR